MISGTPVCTLYKVVQIWPGLICVWTSHTAQQLCDLERVKPQPPPSLLLGLEPVQSCLGVARVMSNYGYKKKKKNQSWSYLNHLVWIRKLLFLTDARLFYYVLWNTFGWQIFKKNAFCMFQFKIICIIYIETCCSFAIKMAASHYLMQSQKCVQSVYNEMYPRLSLWAW